MNKHQDKEENTVRVQEPEITREMNKDEADFRSQKDER